MTMFKATTRRRGGVRTAWSCQWSRLVITTRTSWMANNATPDSIIMNMIFRSLVVPPVEPNVCSTEVGLTSKNTLRILNTIKPVARAFTTMDAAKAVKISVFPQGLTRSPCFIILAPSAASQVARGDKIEIDLSNWRQIDWPMYVIDKNEGIITTPIFSPHTIQQR